jgi:hypothetical protein
MTPPNDRLRLASVEITRRCNNACAYCDVSKSDDNMPLDRFVAVLDKLGAEGFEVIALGGGEPTLHPMLDSMLAAACHRGFRTGLTTNARDPVQVVGLVERGLLASVGVSASKGDWQSLSAQRWAVVNLLLVRGGLPDVLDWATVALRRGSRSLLLLGYKGVQRGLIASVRETADAFVLLSALARQFGATVAADDCTRRRLLLSDACGDGFVRVALDGSRDRCCFPACEFR